MRKVILTGTAGFIGMHTTLRLIKEGYEVVGIDNINDYYDVSLKHARLEKLGFSTANVEYGKKRLNDNGSSFIKLNIDDYEGVLKVFESEKPDAVINLAAQAGVRHSLSHPHVYIDSNITGFVNILEACRANRVKHLIYASSSSVYGLVKNMPFAETVPANHPISLYAASKKANELLAHSYAHLFRIPCTGLRFFTAYGPWGRPDMALFIFTKKILEGEPIEVFNEGKMIRDFTYVEDIVAGVVGLVKNPPSPNANFDPANPDSSTSSAPYALYNIGNSSPVELMEFVRAIEKSLGKKAEIIYKPLQPGDVTATYADTTALQNAIGYKPKTKVEEGVGKFVEWFREYYNM